MRIAIIGAGFTGLSAGLRLSKIGHNVTIFEKENIPGGLAAGFKDPQWKWSLEKYYHHWFTNDKNILSLAKEMKHDVWIKRPKTSVFVENEIHQFDSPLNVFQFPKLNLIEKIRMGLVIGLFKLNPFWKLLETYRASSVLPRLMGKKPYKQLWKPLLVKKFGNKAKDISLAWFWARIKKRTPSLAYPKGGFLEFANAIVFAIQKRGGKTIFNNAINKISTQKNGMIKINNLTFDKVIVTLSSSAFVQITPQLPEAYKQKLLSLKGLAAINLVLRLKKPFFKDKTYWLNVCDEKYPLMAIIEHTNFIDKESYNNERLVYLGNYLKHNHAFMKMNKNQLLKIYDPILKKINKEYKSNIINIELFSSSFAQPIIPVNYSKIRPPFLTPLKNVYLANIQQVYPWDRGTNYAVELGEKVANAIFES